MNMEEHPMEVSPRVLARIGGALYLIMIVLGALGEVFVRGRIVVGGDATATAANLRSMESLWRFGIASELFQGICAVVLALIIYVLTRPVSKDLALLAAFFNLIAIGETAYSLQLVEALFPLGSAGYLKASDQRLRPDSGSRPSRSDIHHHCRPCVCWGGIILPVASCEGRDRSTIEGAGQRRGGIAITARHPHLIQ
jgi:Domain of unknown function (DUF4386)